MSFKLSVANKPLMLSVVMLSVVMLSVVMLSVVMLSVVMLSVVMLRVVMLRVVVPSSLFCHSIRLLLARVPGPSVIKLFTSIFTNIRNKLEYLSLASLSSLALCL